MYENRNQVETTFGDFQPGPRLSLFCSVKSGHFRTYRASGMKGDIAPFIPKSSFIPWPRRGRSST